MDLSKGLLLATANKNKIKEISSILKDVRGLKLVTLLDTGFADLHVAETGRTFKENAFLKARAYAAKYKLPTLADDSGLEVDYLGGEPGVNSARYAGDMATDTERINKLLEAMRGVSSSQRRAIFKCIICLYEPVSGENLFSEGTCEGRISDSKRGSYGFGYDPIFVVTELNKHMAELAPDLKNRISHRAKALEALKDAIEAFCKF